MTGPALMPAGLREAVDLIGFGQIGWSGVVRDLGRQYAWEWWNVVGTAHVRESAGLMDDPVIAAPSEMWTLAGHRTGGVEARWLTPVVETVRSTSEGSLQPGEFGPKGSVINRILRVRAVVTSSMVLHQAAPSRSSKDIAGVVAELVPGDWSTLDRLVAVCRSWFERDGLPSPGPVLPLLGAKLGVDLAAEDELLVSASAAVAFLTAHGLVDLVDPARWVQLDELASRTWSAGGADPRTAVMLVLDTVVAVLRRLISAIARPPWSGGQIALVTPTPALVPSPRISFHDRATPRWQP